MNDIIISQFPVFDVANYKRKAFTDKNYGIFSNSGVRLQTHSKWGWNKPYHAKQSVDHFIQTRTYTTASARGYMLHVDISDVTRDGIYVIHDKKFVWIARNWDEAKQVFYDAIEIKEIILPLERIWRQIQQLQPDEQHNLYLRMSQGKE